MPTSKNWSRIKTTLLLLLALILRVYLILQPGHPYDLTTFQIWGDKLLSLGPQRFFAQVWTDYLPLPIYLSSFIYQIAKLFHLSFALTFKIAISLLEVGLILLSSHLAQSTGLKQILFLFLFFSPAFLIDGSLWGQLDGVVSLLLLLSFLFLKSQNLTLSALLFSLAFSTKPIIVLTLPFILLFFLNQRKFQSLFLFSFFFFLFSFALSFPPVRSLNPLKLAHFTLQRILNQASTYPFTTINAFNFWSLKGSFWQPDTIQILGLNAHTFGIIIFLFFYLNLLRFVILNPQANKLTTGAGLSLVLFYTFSTRMHERHLLFGLPLLLLNPTRFSLFLFSFLSFLFSFNNLGVLFWTNHSQTWPFSKLFIIIFSFLIVFASLFSFLSFLHPHPLKKLKKTFFRHRQLFLLALFGFLLRLINLSHPPNMIFDEVYHAFTAREFVRGSTIAWEWWHPAPPGFAYEWTHPPLAKYGMVLGMLIFGQNSFGWRLPSAIVGSLSLVVLYLLAKNWTRSSPIALTASLLLAIDGLHLVQSRIAMNDIYLLLFVLLSLYHASLNRWKSSAIFLGLALASKWSAVYTLIPLAYLFFKNRSFSPKSIVIAGRWLLVAGLTYFISYAPFFFSNHTLSQFIELQKQMWSYHTHLQATHTYQSQPWQWVLGLRPVWYFTSHPSSLQANIYAQSNPLFLWLGLLSFLFLRFLLVLIAYLSFLLPWLFSPRIMFFYHYLPSLPFLAIALADFLHRLSSPLRRLAFILLLFSFLALLPLLYGFPVPTTYWHSLFALFPSWR